ncbi:MAG: hypothetical protein SOW41_05435 [Anaerococcus sp.]|nr:hypothetical protein [Peptoniphilaceae bacterium]MDY3055490.1 hypothetical protein [Anaerococcus sp.]
MNKKNISLILAYVGILTGAGLASGQELLQYFISFGKVGLVALAIVGVLHFLLGGAILQLGSHYQATSHIDVLDEVSKPFVGKFLDYSLVFTCFVFGFVMIAGAGSNLNQEFGLSTWIGSLICTLMIIIIGMMDFEKVTRIIGAFTPLILIFVFIASIFTFVKTDFDFDSLDSIARTLTPNTANPIIATINYFAMCIMSAVSMAFVLGGSRLNSKEAGHAGLIGGFLVGILGFLIGFTLFLNIGLVKDADIPMQLIVKEIHPSLGAIMSLVIYGMIFNTAISLFYSMARRFAGDNENKFRIYLIALTAIGFGVSFLGFKQLVAIFYPIIGYVGIVLVTVLVYGWLSQKEEIDQEKKRRFSILHLTRKKIDKDKRFTVGDNRKLEKIAEESILDDDEIIEIAEEELKEEFKD